MNRSRCIFFLIAFSNALYATAETKVEVEATRLRGNQELPKVLYVVPWKDSKAHGEKHGKVSSDPKLVLHNLLGELYDPQLPTDWKQE